MATQRDVQVLLALRPQGQQTLHPLFGNGNERTHQHDRSRHALDNDVLDFLIRLLQQAQHRLQVELQDEAMGQLLRLLSEEGVGVMVEDLEELVGDREETTWDEPLGREDLRVGDVLLKSLDNKLDGLECGGLGLAVGGV